MSGNRNRAAEAAAVAILSNRAYWDGCTLELLELAQTLGLRSQIVTRAVNALTGSAPFLSVSAARRAWGMGPHAWLLVCTHLEKKHALRIKRPRGSVYWRAEYVAQDCAENSAAT